MSATLDRENHYGEYTGGTSDPRLIRRLQDIHPARNTPEEETLARRYVDKHTTDATQRDTVLAMIFGVVA